MGLLHGFSVTTVGEEVRLESVWLSIQTKDREIGAGWAERRETSETWNGEFQEGIAHSYRSTAASQSPTPMTCIYE